MDRPILFSGEMVRAILEGRKTQTRRVIKPQPEPWVTQAGYTLFTGNDEISFRGVTRNGPAEYAIKRKYNLGDRLWVRESFAPNYFDNGQPGYKADWTKLAAEYVQEPRWYPSIHMPRYLSRITLEVVSVRAELVQEISEEDAKAEGILPYPDVGVGVNYLLPYRNLWDRINAKRGYSWASNPWVWVIEFKRVQP